MDIRSSKPQSISGELATPILSSLFILMSFMGSNVVSWALINRSMLSEGNVLATQMITNI